jgi:hypothetical protein
MSTTALDKRSCHIPILWLPSSRSFQIDMMQEFSINPSNIFYQTEIFRNDICTLGLRYTDILSGLDVVLSAHHLVTSVFPRPPLRNKRRRLGAGLR